MSFGLALMLVMGVFAAMLALGTFSASNVGADHDSSGTTVTAVSARAIPNTPGDPTKMTFIFDLPITGGTIGVPLNALADVIKIEFDDDVTVPPVLDRNTITITASRITLGAAGVTNNVTGSFVVTPLDVTVELVGGPPRDQPLVTLTVPDMDPSTNAPALNSIAGSVSGAAITRVTVIFRQSAGILNPTESQDGGGSFSVEVQTTDDGGDTELNYVIPRTIELSANSGERGKTITVIGKGFEDGTTATIWRDSNEDGTRDATEIDLATALVGSDNTFTATFVLSNPPFVVGLGDRLTDDPVGLPVEGTSNALNAIDGEDNRIDHRDAAYDKNVRDLCARFEDNPQSCLSTIDLQGGIFITPSTAAVGDTVQITLQDWAIDTLITDFSRREIGTQTVVPIPIGATTDGNGEVTFDFVVPNGVLTGVVTLTFDAGPGSTETKDMTITGAVLTLTPTTVVPNQSVTIVGRGYSNAATINDLVGTVADSSVISISGSTLNLKAAGGTTRTARFNANATVTTDNGGNWSANLVLPINSVTTSTGVHTLKIQDSLGREGVIDLNISPRTLTLDPVESRIGSFVTVTGTGFPADNTATGADAVPSVSILYTVGNTSRTVATFTPDAAGNLSGSFKVPLDAGIPSTNSVRAQFTCPANTGCTTVTTSASHEVPRAVVTIDPNEGPSGTPITISGVGFRSFSTVSLLEIGGIDVRPAPVPSTDDQGNFPATFIVPQLNTGAQSVVAQVGNTTASASFTVTEAAVVPTPSPLLGPTAPAEAFAALIANNDNLLRVWHFDPATQNVGPDFGWFLYDPRPVFAAANTVTEIAGGKFYWINVRENQTALVCGATKTLFAGWNPVTC